MAKAYDLVLINPAHPYLVHPGAQAPIGLLYLAGAAERAGLSVKIVDLARRGLDPHAWRLPPGLCYGITGTYLDAPFINSLAREIKEREPDSRVIVGGPVSLSKDKINQNHVDRLVIGEAETHIKELVSYDHLSPGTPFFCLTGECVDVNAIPWPARHLWPGKIGGNVFLHDPYFEGPSATILSSRGCPWKCAFCASQNMLSRKVRCRDPEDVAAEMEHCVKDFGIRQFRFSDEFLTAHREHIHGLCRAIWASSILGGGQGIAWRASVAVKPNGLEMWQDMRRAGCREVSFGVESADQAVLDMLNCKKGTTEDARIALENASAAGLVTRALLMVGTPGETRHTAAKNIAFLLSGRYDGVAVAIFTPIPGCAVAENPGAFKCRIKPGALETAGLCLYGPAGRNPIEPTIESELIGDAELRHQMELQVDVAEIAGKIGRG